MNEANVVPKIGIMVLSRASYRRQISGGDETYSAGVEFMWACTILTCVTALKESV